ncbi:DNA-binding transcriptional regulator, MerR family [Cetobacterium ceti]|uniref:DNA-binding transcriptional regulator, MerR family n=1 Tax=Cetobacterium ceti TaxID=180163 RepID=A0A1T4N7V1_9FUSO|nr:MerR family transcriptional regulator [Cetobacterium ceti]SJZ75304.1 DNA-binding transcriptional regulator, MerR family [Cetobacterium ceti]
MEKKYKISDVAKIFNISRQTLIYYDKINLFKPEYKNEENNYRYYSDNQLYDLYFILALKEGGFSLKEIENYYESTSNNCGEKFLNEKILEIDKQILKLKNLKTLILKKQMELKNILDEKDTEPKVEFQNKNYLFNLKVNNIQGVTEAIKKLDEIKKQKKIGNEFYITSLTKEDILSKNFYKINTVGILLNEEDKKLFLEKYEVIEPNLYGIIYHKDIYDNIHLTYEKLLKFIEKNDYIVIGSSLAKVNGISFKLKKGMGGIIKIMIPIKKNPLH